MLFASNKSKFHQESRLVRYFKLTSLVLIIITPFALIQFYLLSNNPAKFNDGNQHYQFINQKPTNISSRASDSNHYNTFEDQQKHVYDRKLDRQVKQENNLIVDGRAKELFDINQFLNYNPEKKSQFVNRSILRIRRQSSSFDGLTTRPPQAIIDSFVNHLPEAHDGNLEFLRALERSAAEEALKNGSPFDGQAVASEQNDATAPLGTTGGAGEPQTRRTMVMVSSKTGEFNRVLPLDDLIVSPANIETQQPSDSNAANHLDSSNSENGQYREPDLAELTAAGTAAGLFLSNLAADRQNNFANQPVQRSDHHNNGQFNPTGGGGAPEIGEVTSELNERPIMRDLSGSLNSYNEGQSTNPFQSTNTDSYKQPEDQSLDRMPDSMESLMGSEGEQVDEPEGDSNEQPVQYAANGQEPRETIQGDINSLHSMLQPQPQAQQVAPEERDGTDAEAEAEAEAEGEAEADHDSQVAHRRALESHQRRQNLNQLMASPLPQEFPISSYHDDLSKLYSQSTPDGILMKPNPHFLMTPMRDSESDLNVAAGHYYGKKKKKKVKKKVVKKKKKVIFDF